MEILLQTRFTLFAHACLPEYLSVITVAMEEFLQTNSHCYTGHEILKYSYIYVLSINEHTILLQHCFNVLTLQQHRNGILPTLYVSWTITKTRLYNFDPLKPQFYIVKLGFTGV